MMITFLGHAGFLVETDYELILMDPWFNPLGAFDSGWFQFPKNHDLAPDILAIFATSEKAKYVYVSHEHQDHFDLHFLKQLELYKFTYLIPFYRRDILLKKIKEITQNNIILFQDEQVLKLSQGYIKIYIDDQELNRDSAILVNSDGFNFLNLNDCKIPDRLPKIKKEQQKIHAFTAQFSGATWHPTCYKYPQEEYNRISFKKMQSKFESTYRSVIEVNPDWFLPAAGPACFLDPDLIDINFQSSNIFPRYEKLKNYLNKKPGIDKINVPEIRPGDILDLRANKITLSGKREDIADFTNYITAYAENYRDYFTQKRKSVKDIEGLTGKLLKEMEEKLVKFPSKNKINRSLYIGFADIKEKYLCIDFENDRVYKTDYLPPSNFYLLETYSYVIERVLSGELTWEDFSLTFKMQLNREPDIYQSLMQGFLILEPEDLVYFCEKLNAFEKNDERINIEAGGCKYSIKRYCPHQGCDLSHSWIEAEQFVVCPRHRWKFDLFNEGRALSNQGTIEAIKLEDD